LRQNITPNEILQKKFTQSLKGVKADEVYDFLKLVANEFEELLRENFLMAEKIKKLEEAVEEYRHMETTLKNTLIASQKIGQEIKEEAERKSNLLIRESELDGARIIQKAKQRKEKLEEETFQLLNQYRRFRAEFASLLDSHRKMVQAQDSRILLEYDMKGMQDSMPSAEPEIEPEDGDNEKPQVGEEEIKDLEILFPDEKE
jgi:cell division initiation protein